MAEGNGNGNGGNGAMVVHKPQPRMDMGERGLQLRDVESLYRFAQMCMKSDAMPRSYKSAEQVCVAIEWGREIGLPPMAAVANIAPINGKMCLYGDGPLALCYGSEKLAWIKESMEGTGDDVAAVCTTQRVGAPEPKTTRFTVAMAKKSKLWGKTGPWTDYPARMLMWRARSWNLRDSFPDVLLGIGIAEEWQDVTPPIEASHDRLLQTTLESPADGAPTPPAHDPLMDEGSSLEPEERMDVDASDIDRLVLSGDK